MVMRYLVLALAGAWLVACSFNERDFGGRACVASDQCPRPDQACIDGACTRMSCATADECGTGFKYTCEQGACVVAECSGGQACPEGYACGNGYCQGDFNVASVASVGHTAIAITFDAPPDPVSATRLENYAIDGLGVTGTPALSGSTVTLTTSAQTETSYTVTVTGVVRELDQAPLIMGTGTFTGRAAFGVVSALASSAISVRITFTDPPDPTSATNIANYTVDNGLNVVASPAPVVSGNTVTVTTGPQGTSTYTVMVANVRRAGDNEILGANTATFQGRSDFNLADVTATTNTRIVVTFDAAPNPTQATNINNYSIPDLELTSSPTLVGNNAVAITTASQQARPYTLTVTGVTRNADGEALTVSSMAFAGRMPFNVDGANAVTSRSMSVTFDAAPDPVAATTLSNYAVGGLTLTGTPVLAGNVVTIDTGTQADQSYTVTVSNVTRAADGEALTNFTATFQGRTQFNVIGATAMSSTSVRVTFDAPPNTGQAAVPSNYAIAGLEVLGASVADDTVTLTTTPQMAATYTVMVAGVTRGSDGEALTAHSATFTGRTPFNVMAAAAPTSSTITVTFDAAPNSTQATVLGNYDVPGLVLTGTPALAGNTVTLTLASSDMLAQSYTVFVTSVTRAADGEPLSGNTAAFTGRPTFNVSGAAPASNVSVTVTFDAAPDAAQAQNAANYAIGGLTVMAASLAGNTVTLTTSSQLVQSYTVTVSGVTRAADAEPLAVNTASFTGLEGFNVIAAVSQNRTTVTVTFDAAPNPTQAQTIANYAITGNGGLTVSSAVLAGNTVTLGTSAQAAGTYTVTVENVTRGSDASPLSIKSAQFTYVSFNVTSAAAITNQSASLTYDAPPTSAQATNLGNYSVACSPNPCTNITLSSPVLADSTVTFTTTSQQAGKTYTITVGNVTRNSDGSTLSTNSASFLARTRFDVTGAMAPTSGTVNVTFSAAPDPAQAQTLTNYSINPALTLSGTPVLSGNTVTLNTSVQSAISYTVTVANVTRASDGEPLATNMASFTGKAQTTPTVTGVAVQSTVPDNGTTFYNTGSATVVITGTEFNGVNCMTGVKLDDLDGNGNPVGTGPTTCAVNSATQITATFPAGIRSNYAGWNVRVTNSAGTNSTSTQKLVVKAGLLISEIYVGSSGAGNGVKEFIELYNPTATSLDVTNIAGSALNIHVRSDTGADVRIIPMFSGPSAMCGMMNTACNTVIPSHKYWLIASTQSSTDTWFDKRDGVYDASAAQLVVNGGIYISLSSTNQLRVLDKAGWGSAPATVWREGNAIQAFGDNDRSAQRKPGSPNGATTDTDANSNDFNAPSTSLSPRGTRDAAEP
jgi:hypothetical protein